MPTIGHSKPFGLRDLKVTTLDGVTQVDLPAARTLSIKPRFSSGELMGDDVIASVISFIIGADWDMEGGGIPLNALAIITGKPATTAGITPNQTVTFSLDAGDPMPYFKIYGKAIGEDSQDIHAKLVKIKCNTMEGNFQGENFIVTKCSGVAISDGTGVIEWVQNETAADLPST